VRDGWNKCSHDWAGRYLLLVDIQWMRRDATALPYPRRHTMTSIMTNNLRHSPLTLTALYMSCNPMFLLVLPFILLHPIPPISHSTTAMNQAFSPAPAVPPLPEECLSTRSDD
jgi:hypothetical protein